MLDLVPVNRLSLILLLALAACEEPPPPALTPEAAAARDSILALLREADSAALDAAFQRLEGLTYRVTTRTEQHGPDGQPIASQSATYLVTPRTAERVAADSSGAFEYGGFERFAERGRTVPAFAASPASLVLPAEPAYLDPRGREAFTFEAAGDTLFGDRRVRILTVRARPGEGDDQALRAARLYLDEAGALVGARVERRQESVLFGEASTRTLFLRPTAEGWLPDRLAIETEIHAPLTTPRHFRLDERYTFDG